MDKSESVKDIFTVKPIRMCDMIKSWFLEKHYAHRIPSISYLFGLYDKENILQGVCSFGMPPNYIEMNAWKPFNLLELNRLIVNDGLQKNSLSFFVSQSLFFIEKPKVIISYSDLRQGHHGYIYQATNWIYTGIGGEGQNIYIMKNGTERHQRHEVDIDMKLVDRIEKTKGKARYYFFRANKTDKKKLMSLLRFPIHQYPKGDNKRYDTSFKPAVQGILF